MVILASADTCFERYLGLPELAILYLTGALCYWGIVGIFVLFSEKMSLILNVKFNMSEMQNYLSSSGSSVCKVKLLFLNQSVFNSSG